MAFATAATLIPETRFKPAGFHHTIQQHGLPKLSRAKLSELQLNLGRLCNQACEHCHVDAGPKRKEIMTRETADKILDWARRNEIKSVDLTGGAPEMNPGFRYIVDAFMDMGVAIKSRCNLTVLFEPGQDDLASWYAKRQIHVISSMPCYSQKNVDAQRGKGVFEKSIRALRLLNQQGYGNTDNLILDLVYNPGGAFLPPPQPQLEQEYKRRLFDDYGIEFTRLLTLTNLPVNRFQHYLQRTGQADGYQKLLQDNFNASTVSALMCRHTISVDWLGKVYDCDFNQMLDISMAASSGHYLWDVDSESIVDGKIAVGSHCFGCTAGAGSSCGGALT